MAPVSWLDELDSSEYGSMIERRTSTTKRGLTDPMDFFGACVLCPMSTPAPLGLTKVVTAARLQGIFHDLNAPATALLARVRE